MPKLIALAGPIGCGKDTLAKYLADAYGFAVVSFAAPLKRIAMEVYDLEHRHVHGTQEDKSEVLRHVCGPNGEQRTPRQILEWLGTEGFRTIDPETWVKLGMRSIRAMHSHGIDVVVSDTRFENEFDAIRAAGGQLWYLEKVGGRQERTGHASDEAFREYFRRSRPDEYITAAAGDLDALYERADGILAR